jgi:hypothetical protein
MSPTHPTASFADPHLSLCKLRASFLRILKSFTNQDACKNAAASISNPDRVPILIRMRKIPEPYIQPKIVIATYKASIEPTANKLGRHRRNSICFGRFITIPCAKEVNQRPVKDSMTYEKILTLSSSTGTSFNTIINAVPKHIEIIVPHNVANAKI